MNRRPNFKESNRKGKEKGERKRQAALELLFEQACEVATAHDLLDMEQEHDDEPED